MDGGLHELIAAEKRLDEVVAASNRDAARLIEEAKAAAERIKTTLAFELGERRAEIERRAATARAASLVELEEAGRRARAVFDQLDAQAIDRLAGRVIDRVLTSLEEEARR